MTEPQTLSAQAQEEREARLARIEDLLSGGAQQHQIVRLLAKPPPDGYELWPRTTRALIVEVYKRWQEQREREAPHRRERLIRMAEQLYLKTQQAKKFSAAAGVLTLLSRLYNVAQPDEEQREQLQAQLGPLPEDPSQYPLYTQKALMLTMVNVASSTSMDQQQRMRFLVQYGQAITHGSPQALASNRIQQLETQLSQLAPRDATQLAGGETEEAIDAFAARLAEAMGVPPTEH